MKLYATITISQCRNCPNCEYYSMPKSMVYKKPSYYRQAYCNKLLVVVDSNRINKNCPYIMKENVIEDKK